MSSRRLTRRTSPSFALLTLLSGAATAGCGATRPAAPKVQPETAKPAASVSSARASLQPPEQPLTPAEFVLLTEEPLFAGELGAEVIALGPGQAGFVARGK